jgi:hypothetical protein
MTSQSKTLSRKEEVMRKALLIISVGLVCLLLAMWGCERHITGAGGGGGGTVANLFISAEDTVLATPAGVIDSTTITVTATDGGGVGVPGQSVEMWMDTNVGLLRSISADTTDYNGQISTIFRVNANFGSNVIHARVGGAEAHIGITVNQVNVAQVTLQASPNVLNVSPGSTASCSLTVWIRDDMGNGVASVMPTLQSIRGIIQNFSRSDNSGRVVTTYFTSGDTTQYGIDTVVARVGDKTSMVTITVNRTAGLTGSIEMTTDLNVIYADGPGITYANVFALLKDANNQVIANDTVTFSSTAGTIMSNRITDSLGIARTTFDDIGIATEPDSSMIICRYARFGISDTIYIKILEMQPISHITVAVNPTNMIAGVDSASCIATVFQENGEFAPAGTSVIFTSDSGGTFQPSNVAILNTNGQATVYFKAPNATGTTNISATCSGVTSNGVECHIIAGRARNLLVTVDPPELLANAGATAIVYVTVSDSLGNLVGSGVYISLTASLGYIYPAASTVFGIATTTYNPGTSAGLSIITAHDIYGDSATATVPIISGGPSSITLTSNTSSITVAGVGGNEQAILTANVRDASSNVVPDGNVVYFRILNYASLGGINLNNHGIQDSSQTANGNASVTLNSGTVSGPVVIRAWTFTDSTHTIQISATLSGIVVGSGPPYSIIVGHNNLGADGQSGNWIIDVHASVADIYTNPVRDGWAVFFSVTPDTANVVVDSVVTGNSPLSGSGNPVPGNAYSQLSYNGSATFEEVTLRATCKISESDSVYGVETFPLPMQSCVVTLYCEPIHWHFGMPGQETYSRIKCTVTVRDGHTELINNALVIFFSTRGEFYTAANGGTQVDRRLTGQPPDEPGEAVLWLRGYPAYVFPDPQTPEVVATVNASVYGYQACTTTGVQVLFQR